jgi:hypothetical protein
VDLLNESAVPAATEVHVGQNPSMTEVGAFRSKVLRPESCGLYAREEPQDALLARTHGKRLKRRADKVRCEFASNAINVLTNIHDIVISLYITEYPPQLPAVLDSFLHSRSQGYPDSCDEMFFDSGRDPSPAARIHRCLVDGTTRVAVYALSQTPRLYLSQPVSAIEILAEAAEDPRRSVKIAARIAIGHIFLDAVATIEIAEDGR